MTEFVFGEGKISGYLSVTLGSICLGAVFCFHYPEFLTTPELRAVYPVAWLRILLASFIFLGLLLGVVGFVLSRKKIIPLIGILMLLLATILGGSEVGVPDKITTQYYLGLDWFVLDLLIVGLIFIPYERLYPLVRNQKLFRLGWQTDISHFGISHLLIQITSFLILSPALWLGRFFSSESLQAVIQTQPIWLQFLEIVIVADFTQYWIHRLFHQVPWLWRFHAIHHSSMEMDWLAGSRLHLFDIIVTRGLTLIPLFLFGFSETAMRSYLVFVAFFATFIHVNSRFNLRVLRTWLVTPIYHHWHHASERAAVDKNFAVHLPILDRIFGSFYLPDRWPDAYGISDLSVPDGYWRQLAYPLKQGNND